MGLESYHDEVGGNDIDVVVRVGSLRECALMGLRLRLCLRS